MDAVSGYGGEEEGLNVKRGWQEQDKQGTKENGRGHAKFRHGGGRSSQNLVVYT